MAFWGMQAAEGFLRQSLENDAQSPHDRAACHSKQRAGVSTHAGGQLREQSYG
jgi:hypothetical protein